MYNPSMRIYWFLAILLILVSCGDKPQEQTVGSTPTEVTKPPISTNPDSSGTDEPVSVFETEEFKNSLKNISLKERILLNRGYRMKKNEAGEYIWEEYTYKNELGGTLKWEEGVFITKFRTKIGGPTHDLITGDELPHFSEEMTLYHTQPVYEFLNLENWPKLEKYLGETQNAIADHYNKYINDLDASTKLDLEGKYQRVANAYSNAKSYIDSISTKPYEVADWELILNTVQIQDIVWISRDLDFVKTTNTILNGGFDSLEHELRIGKIKLLENQPDDVFAKKKKFKVIVSILTFIQPLED